MKKTFSDSGKLATNGNKDNASELATFEVENRYFAIVKSKTDGTCVFWIYDETFNKISSGLFDSEITTLLDAILELLYQLIFYDELFVIDYKKEIKVKERGLIKKSSKIRFIDSDILYENVEKEKAYMQSVISDNIDEEGGSKS